MKKRFLWMLAAILICGTSTMLTSCSDNEDNPSTNPDPGTWSYPTEDLLSVNVTADIPTVVLSSFDDTSMGAALIRRLPSSTKFFTEGARMVLMKAEDVNNISQLEWLQTMWIMSRGGYLAIEKPTNAKMMEILENLGTQMAQAEQQLLTSEGDIEITPPSDGQAAARITSAQTERFKARLANMKARAARAPLESGAEPLAELAIFASDCFYTCAPFKGNSVSVTSSDEESDAQHEAESVDKEYTKYSSGLLADGAAYWLNTRDAARQERLAEARSITRGSAEGSINDMLEASDEFTYQNALTGVVPIEYWYINKDDVRVGPVNVWTGKWVTYDKQNAYQEVVRVWGVHNMENNRDYYLVKQKVLASVGGKAWNGNPQTTLYYGPYASNKWWEEMGNIVERYYGSWYDAGTFSMNLTGAGTVVLEEAIPTTDNNNISTSVALGQSQSMTMSMGMTLVGGILPFASKMSYGMTQGSTYTMETTENAKEMKCVKNTNGSEVTWQYTCGKSMPIGFTDVDKHELVPDALINDVDINNQACWSVSNPEGTYTLNIQHINTVSCLATYRKNSHFNADNRPKKDKVNIRSKYDNGAAWSLQLKQPNRATQTWYMDVTFPEIGTPGYTGVKGKLIEVLQRQFPDIYQPTIKLADLTDTSESTIMYIVNASKNNLTDPNASQTLKEYALDMGVSQFTIKWYTTDGKHNTYTLTVKTRE